MSNLATVDNWELVRKTIASGATPAELELFCYHARRTGLDPLARQIYAIHRDVWDPATRTKESKMSIQISIDGQRLVAERTGEYRGQTPAQWCGPDGVWMDVWVSDEPPVAARVGVHRAGWLEPLYAVATLRSYAQRNRDGGLNQMWSRMPDVMLAKCAESLALRKAFPQELSGLYTAEEMGQADNPPPPREEKLDIRTARKMVLDLSEKVFPNRFDETGELVSSSEARFCQWLEDTFQLTPLETGEGLKGLSKPQLREVWKKLESME